MHKSFTVIIIVLSLMVFDFGLRLINPAAVKAQSSSGVFESPSVVSSISQCGWISGAVVTNGVAFCFVNTGVPSTSAMYFSLNGSTTWTPLVSAATGVLSFGNPPRTGNVVLTKTDITQTGITASVPAISAPIN